MYNTFLKEYRISIVQILTCILCLFFSFAIIAQTNPNGYNKFYDDEGNLISEGNMSDGKPVGEWKTYYKNGQLKSVGKWEEGQLHDNWKFYRADGTIENSFTYKNGLKYGLAKIYDADGNLIEETFFKSNKKDSISKIYYPSGVLRQEIQFVEGKEDGKSVEFAEDGRVITNYTYDSGFTTRVEKINRYDENNKKVGVWKEFYKDGIVKSEQEYENGIPNGISKSYDRNGSLVDMKKYDDGVIEENAPELFFIDLYREYHPDGSEKLVGGKKNGKKQGIFREYDQKGNIVNGYLYEDDKIIAEGIIDAKGNYEGDWKYYYLTGELKAEGKYVNGVKDDEWIYYHRNGKQEQKGKYKKGEPTGFWKWTYSNGITQREEYYRKGKREGASVEYDTTGEIIAQGEYIYDLHEGDWYYKYNDYSEKGSYRDGQKEGVWKQWYGDDQLRFEGEYINGYEEGKHKYFYPNRRIKMEGKYKSGRRIGTWKKYSLEGLVTMEITYKNGVEYKINGKKIKPNL